MVIQQWLLTEILEKDDANSLYICNVYGPTHYRDKLTFWEALSKDLEDLGGKKLIIVRDFNTTISQLEKRGGTKVKDPFGERMEDLISYFGYVGCSNEEQEVHLEQQKGWSRTYSGKIGQVPRKRCFPSTKASSCFLHSSLCSLGS